MPFLLRQRITALLVFLTLGMWSGHAPVFAAEEAAARLLSGPLRYHSAPMLLIDADSGVILDANDAAAVFYGYSIKRLIDMDINQINVMGAAEVAEERLKALREERNYFVFPHRLADGSIHTVEVFSAPVMLDGGRQALLSIVLDTAGKKMADSEMLSYKGRLEELISQRTDRLVSAHADVRESLQATILFQAAIILLLVVTLLYRRQVQKALERQKLMAESMLDSSLQFMGLLDLEGHLLHANQTALDRFGVSQPAVFGRFLWETDWWSHSPEEQLRLKRAVMLAAMGEESRFETRHPLPGGTMVDVDFSIRPVLDAGGKPVNLLVEGRDISLRKQAEQQLLARRRELQDANSYLKTLIEALPDTLMELDESGRIYQFHSMHPDFPAPTPDGAGGWSIQDSLSNDASEVILSALRQAKEKGGVQGAAFRQFELSVTPLPESEGLASRYVVLLRQVAGRQLSS